MVAKPADAELSSEDVNNIWQPSPEVLLELFSELLSVRRSDLPGTLQRRGKIRKAMQVSFFPFQ